MKRIRIISILFCLSAMLWVSACKDDADSSGSNGGVVSASDCEDSCSKAVSCGIYQSTSECSTVCTQDMTTSQLGCIDNCNASLECNEWFSCVAECVPDEGDSGSIQDDSEVEENDTETSNDSSLIPSCTTICAKAAACDLSPSTSECVAGCVEESTSSEAACGSACNSSLACDVWLVCVDACFGETVGNGEYCPGYVMGSDMDECCQTNNPCDWADDFFCDCGGTCSWDVGDCSGK